MVNRFPEFLMHPKKENARGKKGGGLPSSAGKFQVGGSFNFNVVHEWEGNCDLSHIELSCGNWFIHNCWFCELVAINRIWLP